MEEKKKGNPAWVKGVSPNPKGRGKGTLNNWNHKVQATLSKCRRNPVQELIEIADLAKANRNYDLAGKIWLELQQYREAKRKPVEVAEVSVTPEESKERVDAAIEMLEELSGRENQESSNQTQLGNRAAEMAPETSPDQDVRGDSGQ